VIERANLGKVLEVDQAPPDHPAVIDLLDPARPQSWSVKALDQLADSVARGLVLQGFSRGDRIAILAENRAEFLATYLGTMRAGMVTVPINFRLSKDTIEYIFQDAGIGAVIADPARRSLVPPQVRTWEIDGKGLDGFHTLLEPGPWRSLEPRPDEIAKILYTSGSTGRPKGVPLPHRGQLWAVGKYFQGTEAGRRERTPIVAPTYHKNGLFFSMVALSNQYTIVSLPRFDPRTYLQAAATYRCTVLSGIPTMFALMARERDLIESLDFSSVHTVTIGSAPLTDALVGKVQRIFPAATVLNGYGTTEAGPCAFGVHPAGLPRPTLALGYPFGDIEWRLVDGPSPDQGVLELRTPALMPGYLNLPRVTAERIHQGWYSTGDIMRRDPEGFFYFVGRADDMFICGGENVYPGEVEKLLERHPAVAQAAVVPVPDEIKGQIPVAFVVQVPGQTTSEDDLRQFALANGPGFSHPRFVIFTDRIPVATTHKVDRRELIEQAHALARSRGRG
jgi:acyl-CoA synthetase (AMP-forming)/AMP-acid ligase II